MNGAGSAIDLGIVCGMASERRALGVWASHPRIAVGVAGASPERAEALAAGFAARGARVLLSFGVAGGLSAAEPGTILTPEAVVTADGTRWPCLPLPDIESRRRPVPGLTRDLFRRGGERPDEVVAPVAPLGGTLLGADTMVLTASAKRALAGQTRAVAVDMESHGVARAAAASGVALAVLRAIGDPAERDLPEIVEGALDTHGNPRVLLMAWRVLRTPRALPALRQLQADTDAGLKALSDVADSVIPHLIDAATAER